MGTEDTSNESHFSPLPDVGSIKGDLTQDDSLNIPSDDLSFEAEDKQEPHSVVTLLPIPPSSPQTSNQDHPHLEVLPGQGRGRSMDQLEKARKRQETYLQSRRQKKKRKVLFNRLRLFMRFAMSLLLLIAFYFLATASFWRFSENAFTLHGNHLVTRQHILRFLHPYHHKWLYIVNPGRLEETIRQETNVINKIYIRRHLFPNRLDISITEKPVWGVLYTEPLWNKVPEPETNAIPNNNDGAPLESKPVTGANQVNVPPLPLPKPAPKPVYLLHWDNTMTDLASYPLKKDDLKQWGEEIALVSSSTTLTSTEIARYREIAMLLNSIPEQAKLQFLDVSNPYDIIAYFDGFKVHIGHADRAVMDRVSRLIGMIPTIREYQNQISYVDLRWSQQALLKRKPLETLTPELRQSIEHQAAMEAENFKKTSG